MRGFIKAGLVLLVVAALSAGAAAQHNRYPSAASSFVPLDSWVYPAIHRLAGMGYVRSAMLGMKPWTRIECARLTDEAGEQLRARFADDLRVEELVPETIVTLEKEFVAELEILGGGRNRTARVESLYARVTSISGPPLTDALHFGQTVAYDFGRPARRGTNAVAGGSLYATSGPLAAYVRAEYQHAPSAPALADSVLDLIAAVDSKPREPARPFASINRVRLMDAYVTLNVRNWQFSAGRQSLSWGLGENNSLLFSTNAEPLPMLRFTRVVPHRWPWVLRYLGPVRSEFFFSRLDGQTFVPRPYLYGHKTSARPHPRLEIAYARTTMVGGGSYPLTPRVFFNSFFGKRDPVSNTNPGDSRTTFDFSWVLPAWSDSLTLYAELYQEDTHFFFIRPWESAFRPGLYFARLPGLPRMDLRLELASTESVGRRDHHGNLNYWNFEYRDGYAHRGFLLGNTVGRQGRAFQAEMRYWFSPRHVLEFEFRHNSVSSRFIPGGGLWNAYRAGYEKSFSTGFYLRSSLQVERIQRFPALFSRVRNNVAATFELGFLPEQPRR